MKSKLTKPAHDLLVLKLLIISFVVLVTPALIIILASSYTSTTLQERTLSLIGITAATSLSAIAGNYVYSSVSNSICNAQIKRARTEAQFYRSLQAELAWKTRVLEHAAYSKHPPIGPTKVNPHARLEPFTLLKQPVHPQRRD